MRPIIWLKISSMLLKSLKFAILFTIPQYSIVKLGCNEEAPTAIPQPCNLIVQLLQNHCKHFLALSSLEC